MYLGKPVNFKKLFEALSKYLSSKGTKNKNNKIKNKRDIIVEAQKGKSSRSRKSPENGPATDHIGANQDNPIDMDVIDWSELVTHIESEELIKEIMSSFFADNNARLKLLEGAVKAENLEEIETLSHALKGSASTVSAKPLSQAASHLNIAVKTKDTISNVESLFADIQTEFDRLKTLLDQPDWVHNIKSKTNGTS
jgi:HPt (histidine-containing phosphotransfer) domain-containing protein